MQTIEEKIGYAWNYLQSLGYSDWDCIAQEDAIAAGLDLTNSEEIELFEERTGTTLVPREWLQGDKPGEYYYSEDELED
ncbi:MAG: hypothetical protein K2M17_02810 [Bacilli bacterium]|nr:hypothetical protein [Bacilli bacterium]